MHDDYTSPNEWTFQQLYGKHSRQYKELLYMSDSTGPYRARMLNVKIHDRILIKGLFWRGCHTKTYFLERGFVSKGEITAAHKNKVTNSTFGEHEHTAHQH